ncbi:hypothetical protein ED92_00120 [Amycolatopsis sp. MJM2582]|uniref:hypothetical protein n=1 Tax=Amycolatopsis sp. MJM2582 TaxID=1427749 RepID=UPI0004FF9B0D|nr:hypothetical protein [Amycolatopsis sp. MJM2582]KFZ82337.1 hypothetical protein ED92_00120 [Amycolatopsis sp. MJM2582]
MLALWDDEQVSSNWKIEIIECGDLVQDDDEVESQDEAERRWNRYVELADSVTGDEGPTGVAAIVRSLKAKEDYGAYQSAHAALLRFPGEDLGEGMAQATSDLLVIPKDNSGNVLMLLVHAGSVAVSRFNDALRAVEPRDRREFRQLIEFHESEEWLSDATHRNVLMVPRGVADVAVEVVKQM